jgi:ABC-2 type transport system permease protein
MILNDIFWVGFWCIYFTRFPVVHGWHLNDIITVWALAATGFGIALGIFGNVFMIAGMVARGEVDFYLTLPRNVLLHMLVSRMGISAWGDMIFGSLVYIGFVHPNLIQFVMFLGLAVLAGLVIVSASVIVESLSSYTGGAEGLASQYTNALISFSTYPMGIFDGAAKVMLYTLIPAAFISYVPVLVLRRFDCRLLIIEIAAASFISILAWYLFHLGLRRYESGNTIAMRG